jgi:hypothetical protein
MHANINQSTYRRLENEWAKAIKAGKTVDVTVELRYESDGRRPEFIGVNYVIDDGSTARIIRNRHPPSALHRDD